MSTKVHSGSTALVPQRRLPALADLDTETPGAPTPPPERSMALAGLSPRRPGGSGSIFDLSGGGGSSRLPAVRAKATVVQYGGSKAAAGERASPWASEAPVEAPLPVRVPVTGVDPSPMALLESQQPNEQPNVQTAGGLSMSDGFEDLATKFMDEMSAHERETIQRLLDHFKQISQLFAGIAG